MKATAVLVTLTLVLLAPPAVSQVPDDKLIVPGVRIGKWTLEMSIDDLTKVNGPGESGRLRGDDVQDGLALRRWSPLGLEAVHRVGQTRVEYLSIGPTALADAATVRSFTTGKGIGISAKGSQVFAAYGPPTAEIYRMSGAKRPIYDGLGIAFWLIPVRIPSQDFDVATIYLFRPGAAKTIWKF